VHRPATESPGKDRQGERDQETRDRIERKRKASPFHAARVIRGLRINCAENVARRRGHEKHPHAKESKPGKHLHQCELSHGGGHVSHGTADFTKQVQHR
jgi:hypothetical protein